VRGSTSSGTCYPDSVPWFCRGCKAPCAVSAGSQYHQGWPIELWRNGRPGAFVSNSAQRQKHPRGRTVTGWQWWSTVGSRRHGHDLVGYSIGFRLSPRPSLFPHPRLPRLNRRSGPTAIGMRVQTSKLCVIEGASECCLETKCASRAVGISAQNRHRPKDTLHFGIRYTLSEALEKLVNSDRPASRVKTRLLGLPIALFISTGARIDRRN